MKHLSPDTIDCKVAKATTADVNTAITNVQLTVNSGEETLISTLKSVTHQDEQNKMNVHEDMNMN